MKKKLDIVSKMTMIGVIAITILALTAAIAACSMGAKKPKESLKPIEETPETPIIEDAAKPNYDRALGVVKHVDTATNQLMVYDIEDFKLITLKMDSSIVIKDEYGTDIALSQIEVGDMVETKYDLNTFKPENVRITAVTWTRKDVSNMVVDSENKVIRIANESYTYTDELVTSKNGLPFDLTELTPADEALVKGYQGTVWSIILVSGHGTLTLQNHSAFVGGQLEVGNRNFFEIKDQMTVPVAAGVHDVIITKDNMAPYVAQIMVTEGQEVVIDLSEAQPKVGTINILVMQEDVTVYINDEVVDARQEQILDFGTYKVRAVKEGYASWESDLIVEQAYVQFTIDLEKKPTFLHIQEPAGAEAYLDGAFVGIIPLETPYEPGTHMITLRQDGFFTKHHNFVWEDSGEDQYLVLPALVPMTDQDTTQEDGTLPPETDSNSGETTGN